MPFAIPSPPPSPLVFLLSLALGWHRVKGGRSRNLFPFPIYTMWLIFVVNVTGFGFPKQKYLWQCFQKGLLEERPTCDRNVVSSEVVWLRMNPVLWNIYSILLDQYKNLESDRGVRNWMIHGEVTSHLLPLPFLPLNRDRDPLSAPPYCFLSLILVS